MGIVRLAKCLKTLNSLIEHKDRSTDIKNKISGNFVYMDFISIVYKIQLIVANELNYLLFSFLLINANMLDINILTSQKFLNTLTKYKNIVPNSDELIEQVKNEDIKITESQINIYRQNAQNTMNEYVYISIINYIVDLLANKLIDVEYVLIAFDGIPSFGKIQEQRQRRYMRHAFIEFQKKINSNILNETNKNSVLYIRQLYDKENITINIKQAIEYVYNKYHSSDLQRDISEQLFVEKHKTQPELKINIVVDVIDRPYGEGEKILMDKLIQDAKKHKDNKTYVFYSPDGDSVLLCLNVYIKTKIQNLNVVKIFNQYPTKVHNESSQYVNIQTLYNNIVSLVNKYTSIEDKHKDNICCDFILLMNFFGNDFIHQIPTMEISCTFMDVMYIYAQYIKENNYLTTYKAKTNINLKSLSKFLRFIAEYEYMFMLDTYMNDIDERQQVIRTFGDLFSFRYALDYRKHIVTKKTHIYEQIIKKKISIQDIKMLITDTVDTLNQITTISNRKYGDIWMKTEVKNITEYANKILASPQLLISSVPKYIYNNKLKKTRTKKEIKNAIKIIEKKLLTNNEPINLNKQADTISKAAYDFGYDYTNIRNLIPHEQMPTTDNDIDIYMLEWRSGDWMTILNAYPIEFGYDIRTNSIKKIENEMDRHQYDIMKASNTKLKKMVIDYLKTLSWMVDYYMNTDHDSTEKYISTWSYNYNRSPFITHIAEYTNDLNFMKNVYKNSLVPVNEYLTSDKHKFYIYPHTSDTIGKIQNKYKKYFPDMQQYINEAIRDYTSPNKKKSNDCFNCMGHPYFSKCEFKAEHMSYNELIKFNHKIK